MTSAEFKMIRRLLGITTDDVAAIFNVALRSARRWETTHQPPQGVADWLRGKLAETKTAVYEMLDHIEAEAQTNPDYVATLPMYRTDDQAKAALGVQTTKEQHAAVMGLVAFFADDDLELTAEYVTQDD